MSLVLIEGCSLRQKKCRERPDFRSLRTRSHTVTEERTHTAVCGYNEIKWSSSAKWLRNELLSTLVQNCMEGPTHIPFTVTVGHNWFLIQI
jgi:hypothetical protein